MPFLRASNLELRTYKRGFTLLEMLLALGILAIISVISVTSLSSANKDKALAIEADKVVSLITKARSLTLEAKDGSVYGVHFEETKAVLFKGSSYSAGASTNQSQGLNGVVKISAISLSGGGAEVVFKKLTGAATQTGTVRLSLASNVNASTTITIAATGTAY